MPTPAKNKKARGVSLYNKILKQFTKINNQLPEDRKVSLKDRRSYISKEIYPKFKGTAASRVGVKIIKKNIFGIVEKIIPKEGCDLNYISPSVYLDISWFEIDIFISTILPKCIYVRVDADIYGKTKIFNTIDYDYQRSGVKAIYERIRDGVNNKSGLGFTGVKSLKRGKPNDGTPENYFLDLIIGTYGSTAKPIKPVIYNLPKGTKTKVTGVRNAIRARLKGLKNKKIARKRARKTASTDLAQIKRFNTRILRTKNPEKRKTYIGVKNYLIGKSRDKIIKNYNKGLYTELQYLKTLVLLVDVLPTPKKPIKRK